MSLVRTARACAKLALVVAVLDPTPVLAAEPANLTLTPSTALANSATTSLFAPPGESGQQRLANEAEPELSLPKLIAEVEARNPSLEAMTAAWQAAAQRYPQVISLEDPMFMAMGAPASFNSNDVESAYAVQLNQKFPWYGKRAARGRQIQAESSAAFHDLQDNRLRLAETTATAFYDYYLATHQLELNRQNVAVIGQFRSTAQTKYSANQVTQQDVLQADLELAQQQRRQLELRRLLKVAIARINTLLQNEPFAPLPPPPQQLTPPSGQMDADALQQLAATQRPDLAALAEKVRGDEAAVTLACKDYYPDAEVFGRYDTFWQPASTQSDLRPQVGITVNVPIYRGRLDAAVREASFRLSQHRADYDQLRFDIQYEVANTSEEVEESRQAVQLFAEKLLPAAEHNVAAARANYAVNKTSFLDLAMAQRQLIELRQDQQQALAAYHTRLVSLQRAVGGTLPRGSGEELPTLP
jgi:cobalt-zinc-cadmium efflux system outer membrane protein